MFLTQLNGRFRERSGGEPTIGSAKKRAGKAKNTRTGGDHGMFFSEHAEGGKKREEVAVRKKGGG